jgi:hypothetical protein
MDPEIEDIKRRLSALEKQDSPSVQPKPEKKKSDYQVHMSNRLKELKTEAESKGVEFDRKQAFSQAAREWTAKKTK